MKLIVKEYDIYNKKILDDIKICLVADFHLSHISSDKKVKLVINDIKEKRPDYICICGDYIDCTNMLDDKSIYDKSILYLKELSNIAKVIFTLGNHDITKMLKRRKHKFDINKRWIHDISNIPNVIFLYNEIYQEKGIRFIGYVLPHKYYYYKKRENEDILIESYKKYISNASSDKLNILLCHSPMRIFNDNVFNNIPSLKNMDIILSGHMHNGMLFNYMDKIWKGNIGLIGPHKKLFPSVSRGIKTKTIDGKKINLIVTGGVTKVQELAPKIIRFADRLYNPQIDYINIKKNIKNYVKNK